MSKPTLRQLSARAMFLRGGYSLSGACALVGNFCREVGPDLPTKFRTANLDHGSNGLAQWRLSRLTNYLNFVKQRPAGIQGRPFEAARDSLDMQVAFVIYELEHDYPALNAKLKAGGDVAALTADVCWQYERPNKALSGIEQRIAYAKALAAVVGEAPAAGRGSSLLVQGAGGELAPMLGIVDHLQTKVQGFDAQALVGEAVAGVAASAIGATALLRPVDGLPLWGWCAVGALAVVILAALLGGMVASRHAASTRAAIAGVTPFAPPADKVNHVPVEAPPDPADEARIAAAVDARIKSMGFVRPDTAARVEVSPSVNLDPYAPQQAGRIYPLPEPNQGVASSAAALAGNDATMTVGRVG